MSDYFVEKIDSLQAEKFWLESPNATAFTNPIILSYFKYDFEWWVGKKGDELLCVWPVCLKNAKIVLPDFFYYFGPIWHGNFLKIPNHSWLPLSKNIYEGFIKKFSTNYKVILAQLPPGLNDVRIFDWWNFNIKAKKRFLIKPKYTAIIKNLPSTSMHEIKMNFRYWRRNELNKIKKEVNSLVKTDNYSLDEVLVFYEKTTGIKAKKYSSSINSLLELAKNNFGKIIAYREKKNNQLASFMLVLFGKKDANLVLSLVSETWKKKGLSVYMILKCIALSKKMKFEIFDFNGANSPNRGDDKHSYGACHELFFEIKYLEKSI
tara:strand:- start:14527 stop:15486 length:960 start_codon:yes stop_codon:yes gene_type:complete